MTKKKAPVKIIISIITLCLCILSFVVYIESKSSNIELTGNNLPIYFTLDSNIQKGTELQKIYYSLDKRELLLDKKVKIANKDLSINDLFNKHEKEYKISTALKQKLQSKFPDLKLNGKELSYAHGDKTYTVLGHSEGIIVIEDSKIETAKNVDFVRELADSNSFSPMLIYVDQDNTPKILVHYYRPLEDGT